MADTPEHGTVPKEHALLEALKDAVFLNALTKAIGKPLGDDRDAEIAALLKSKGLESITEEQVLSALNPPDEESDPTKQPGQDDGVKEPPKPPPAFSFSLYEGKYTITSASHPDGVYDIDVGDGTITMGEEGKAYPATTELDKTRYVCVRRSNICLAGMLTEGRISNKWWVTWGDKAAPDWFAVQFFSAIPKDTKDKTPLLTFKGTWHTKAGDKAVTLDFDGRHKAVTRKDTSEKVAKIYKWGAMGLISYYLVVGLAMYFRQRYLRQQAAARGDDPAMIREIARNQELELVNRAQVLEVEQRVLERRRGGLAETYLSNLSAAMIADFETNLTERMKEVVDNYYEEHGALWERQRGEPPMEAIHEQIKAVISERVERLVSSTPTQINSEFLQGLSDNQKREVVEAAQRMVAERAIDTLSTRSDGRYTGLAGLAFDRVTTFKYAEKAKLKADAAMHVVTELIRIKNKEAGLVFQRLIELANELHEAQREREAPGRIEERQHRFDGEVVRLREELRGDVATELGRMQEHLRSHEDAMKGFHDAKGALDALDKHEKKERPDAERAMRELGRAK